MKKIIYLSVYILLFFCSANATVIQPIATLSGTTNVARLGFSVSIAGDLNNDGYDDVIIGAPSYYDLGNADSVGKAYILFGGPSMDSIPDLILSGINVEDRFGQCVSAAGDMNNDGFGDVMVGAPLANGGGIARGEVYIYFGGVVMDNIPDLVIQGYESYGNYGKTLASVGDVNNDGFGDIIVGAQGEQNYTGRTYLYLGSQSVDTTIDIVFTGSVVYEQFGTQLSSAGDVNNDGFDDILIGSFEMGNGNPKARLYLGGAALDNNADYIFTDFNSFYVTDVYGGVDLNNDNFDDVVVGFNDHTMVYYGGNTMDTLADLSFAAVGDISSGDVNNDGFEDIMIGYLANPPDTSGVLIYFGAAVLDTTADVIIAGASQSFGSSIACNGDLNNDGKSDIVIGAYDAEVNGIPSAGQAYIYDNVVCNQQVIVNSSPYIKTLTESQSWIITSGIVLVPSGALVKLDADPGSYVSLNPGFKVDSGAVFVAQAYNGCTAGAPQLPQERMIANADLMTHNKIVLYPNPTTGLIHIKHDEKLTDIQIFDMVGKLLIKHKCNGQTETNIDLSNLPNGLYYVKPNYYNSIKVFKNE
jgi:hypothetical protein